MNQTNVLILLPDLRGGGAERLHVVLANHWHRQGLSVQLVLMTKTGDLFSLLDPGIEIVDLGVDRIRGVIFPLSRHLREMRPDVIIAAMWPLTSAAVLSWRMASKPGRLYLSDHNQLSVSCVHELELSPWIVGAAMRFTYPTASGLIAVSEGVKADMCRLGGFADRQVRVIYNPAAIGVPAVERAATTSSELWGPGSGPHILSVGALKTQKDQAGLIKAFSQLPESLNARLIILGEGSLRGELEELVRQLGLEGRVTLPGFVIDPYPWYHSADLFVLSSRWEGFGNVIVEALECGVQVVSTDCPSGPSEILKAGEVGRLVPIQDPSALAEAMVQALAAPFDREALKARARDFSVEAIADQYLDYFGLSGGQHVRV